MRTHRSPLCGLFLFLATTGAAIAHGDKPAPPPPPVVQTPAPAFVDAWNGSDKRLHLGVSFVIGLAVSQVEPSKPKAVAWAMVPGLLKEIGDSQEAGNRFSGKDLAANLLGATLGVYTGHWMLKRERDTTTVAWVGRF